MRKKSHISLAGYLVREMNLEEFDRHKKAFYLGSILPDLTPKMITSPHEFQTSYEELQGRIHTLLQDAGTGDYKERVLFRRMGVVMHYLADYFTFPHNKIYPGGFKEHCAYEEHLKHELRAFLKTEAPKALNECWHRQFASQEALFDYIQKMHDKYLSSKIDTAKDIENIVLVNKQVVDGIDYLFLKNHMQHRVA